MKTTIKTGDTIKIISGTNKGTVAKVVKVAPADKLVFIEGIGNRTRHKRPTQYEKGGKKDIHVGIHVSNVKLEKAGEAAATKAKPAKKEGKK